MNVVVSEIQMESIALREKTKKQNSLKCLMHTHSHQHSELKFSFKANSHTLSRFTAVIVTLKNFKKMSYSTKVSPSRLTTR